MYLIFCWIIVLLLVLGMVVIVYVDDIVVQICQYVGDYCLLVLGEFYGICEMLLLVWQLVDGYSCIGLVLLVLELLCGEIFMLCDYLVFDGGEKVCQYLCGCVFWIVCDDQYDGCCSCDMLVMIESLCVLKLQGCVIDVVGYDVNVSKGGNQVCDDFMVVELWWFY